MYSLPRILTVITVDCGMIEFHGKVVGINWGEESFTLLEDNGKRYQFNAADVKWS